ncbi:lipase family protein [Nocardia sp. GCM10030253]|uniref:lipase family protein n=1 Tax=Nocardia sp. GCM10030253 TaxID=3273404 RepID=UPI003640FE36
MALLSSSTVAMAAILFAGCGSPADSPGTRTADRPGTLVSQRPLTNAGPALASSAAAATYMRHVSTAPDKSAIEVSGAVFLPEGVAPDGGWPVVAFAHGTTGVANDCAPTSSPVLFGNDDEVAGLLNDHKAVVMTNYQGLDGPGKAPYLDTPSSGYDVLNSARAAQTLGLPLSKDTVLVGLSQGGRATESAAETAKSYAPELKILGNVLLSPALRIDLAQSIESRTLSAAQYLILPYLVEAVRYGDSGYSDDKVLHGGLLAAAPRLESTCAGQFTAADAAVGLSATADAAQFVDDDARRVFTEYEARGNLPKTATDIPTYIARGDSDTLVDTAWGNQAVAEMCRIGIPVQDTVLPGGHEAFAAGVEQWTAWIDDRFAGTPTTATTCSR